MADLKLGTATLDLAVENGDLALVYDDDAIRQRLRLRLTDVVGDWFRDTEHGVDWFGAILGKRSDNVRRAEFRRVVLATVGVTAVVRLELAHDRAARTLAIELTVIKDDGQPLDVQFANILPLPAPTTAAVGDFPLQTVGGFPLETLGGFPVHS